MSAPAVFTIQKRSVYIKSYFWTDVNKTAATFARKNKHPCECLFFSFSSVLSFSPGAALLCCCRLHIILCLRVPKRCVGAAFHQPCVIKHGDGIAKAKLLLKSEEDVEVSWTSESKRMNKAFKAIPLVYKLNRQLSHPRFGRSVFLARILSEQLDSFNS